MEEDILRYLFFGVIVLSIILGYIEDSKKKQLWEDRREHIMRLTELSVNEKDPERREMIKAIIYTKLKYYAGGGDKV